MKERKTWPNVNKAYCSKILLFIVSHTWFVCTITKMGTLILCYRPTLDIVGLVRHPHYTCIYIFTCIHIISPLMSHQIRTLYVDIPLNPIQFSSICINIPFIYMYIQIFYPIDANQYDICLWICVMVIAPYIITRKFVYLAY